MDKRGIDYTLLIRLFFIAVIIGLSLTVIAKIQDDTLFTELKTLYDLSYLQEAAAAAPEQLSLNYYIPSKFEISFNPDESKFGIKSLEKNELNPITLNSIKTQGIETNIKTENGIKKYEIKKLA